MELKREELQLLIKTENVDVVRFTETWGKAEILDSEMEIPGFKLFWKDRAAVNDKKEAEYHFMFKVVQCDDLNSK